jgi:hypothetical protein
MARRSDIALLVALAAACAVAGGLVGLGHVSPDLLLLAPVLLLAVPLALGRYVGEDALERLRAAVHRPRALRAPVAAPRPRCAPVLAVRGGRLIGAALAVRPPPAPGLTTA